ncbi:hypothetical protein BJ912DRAFT_443736 [Pholiota molesta]|nr:hypothetical protein BJ912DRAFT_443736 [Pholiota molesta]
MKGLTPPARMEESLPRTVEAIRAGWQQTSQGGAVVSGLLASTAAALFNYIRDPKNYDKHPHSKNAVVALCYGALFFNIGATISAFIIIDKLGSLTFVYARRNPITIGTFAATETAILEHYGAGNIWKYILWHWVICFYSGAVCLAALLLTFIWLEELHWIGILMSLLAMFALIPLC